MLLDLLEDPHEIRRICIMGRNCTLVKGNDEMECSVPLEKQIAEGMLKYLLLSVILCFTLRKLINFQTILCLYVSILYYSLFAEEEEEIEMLLENYLQRLFHNSNSSA